MDNTKNVTEALHGLEAWLAPLFSKFPHLPSGGVTFIVGIAPWVAIIFGVLGLLSIVGGGMLLSLFNMLTMHFGLFSLLELLISLALSGAASVLLVLAFKGLTARTKKGWNFVFYSQVVSVLNGLFGAVMMPYGYGMQGLIVSLLVAIIGFWILFEIRSRYSEAGGTMAVGSGS